MQGFQITPMLKVACERVDAITCRKLQKLSNNTKDVES
jgi:hypothetical protein